MALGEDWRYYACFEHKTHAKTHRRDLGRIPKCPICSNEMKFLGITAVFPKSTDIKGWKILYKKYLLYIHRNIRWKFLAKKSINSHNSKMWNGINI